MYGLTAGSGKGVSNTREATCLVHLHPRYKNCFCKATHGMSSGSLMGRGARPPKHYYTCFVRGQVDLHVKSSAEHIKDVQKLLQLCRALQQYCVLPSFTHHCLLSVHS